ncbi:MAG: hypothetical protein NDJ92_04820 [Thermoanaerobaculia bacterium]|nr:hypothetical protein [Thermoanaerobaculia bacterium]
MTTVEGQEVAPAPAPAPEPRPLSAELQSLKGVVDAMLDELRRGAGDRDKRRQVEEWMKALADKYPEFGIESGLRDYYLAEAGRMREEFTRAEELGEKLAIGRSIEAYLDKAAELGRRER